MLLEDLAVEKDNLPDAIHNNGDIMGRKTNLILSLGALFPFFTSSMLIFFFALRSTVLLIPSIILFIISLIINIYMIKYMHDKRQFNPRAIFVIDVNKRNTIGNSITMISLFLSLITILFPRSSVNIIYIGIIFFTVTAFFIIIYALHEKENIISQILTVRLLFYHFYIAKTDKKSTIYIFSKEKLQPDRKIKAYHVTDDVYIFGYRTDN